MNQNRTKPVAAGALLERLMRTNHLYMVRLDAALEAEGLSAAKFGALQALEAAEEPLPLGQLAERLACVRSNITQLVDRLEAEGLVQRVPAPDDRRSKCAAITAEGRRRFALGLQAKRGVERELLSSLTPAEADLLAATLAKLGSRPAP